MDLTADQRSKRNREKKKQNQKELEDYQRHQLKKLRKLPKRINKLPVAEKKAPQKHPQPPQVANKPSGTVPHSLRIKHHNLCTLLKTSLRNIDKYKKALIEMQMKFHLEQKEYEQKLMLLKQNNKVLQGNEEILEIVLRLAYCTYQRASSDDLIKAFASKIRHRTTVSGHGVSQDLEEFRFKTNKRFYDLLIKNKKAKTNASRA